jgi:NAD(P)-dependent dehydrogenase (short-subunit alcohol dehydrogenase family)
LTGSVSFGMTAIEHVSLGRCVISRLNQQGQVAIVTGGARGVGLGISEALLEAGVRLVICGRNEPSALPRVGGNEAVFVAADVRERADAERVFERALSLGGRLDILVNNAGGSPPAAAASASPRFSDAIVRLNLLAPLSFAQLANGIMQRQDRGGVIINVCSVSGLRPSPGSAIYGAAKAGLLSLTQSLAVEWAPKVRVNSVTPGPTWTEQAELHYGDASAQQRVANTVPMKRLCSPRDVGEAVAWLASPHADYVTGANILLHGGGERPAFLDAVEKSPLEGGVR